MGLTHIDDEGKAKMVDVSEKEITLREAVASGRVVMKPETLKMIKENRIKKGDVLATARIAAIMAAKKTPDLIPLAHPIPLSEVSVDFGIDEKTSAVTVEVFCKTHARTGVEMEAIVGVLFASAAIYDMIKSVDRSAVITDVMLIEKRGGKSGEFSRK
jgi:cyclic pyranopterin phosphate synthase